MNDRFKFRYVYENKVYDVATLDLTSNKFAWLDNGIVATINYDNLLQCTGVKDKNGKLIYEGDIVKGVFEDRTLTVIRWSEKDLTWCADFSQVYRKAEYSYYVALADYDSKNLEVIGNIYENPELLVGKND